MELKVWRFGFGRDSSLGEFWINAVRRAWSCEDEGRTRKVWGETRIPAGRYRVGLRTNVGTPENPTFHDRYLKRFPSFHRGMLEILEVPGFTSILIHIGNDDDDTAGCILVGMTPHMKVTRDGCEFGVYSSTTAYKDIYPEIAQAILDGEEVWITIEEFTTVGE